MRYNTLRHRPRYVLAFTGLTIEEFNQLVASIRSDWITQRIERLTRPERRRKIGGGRKYVLPDLEDQLLIVLVWAKLYPAYLFLEYLFSVDESTVSRMIGSIQLLLQDRFLIPDPRKQKGRKKPDLGAKTILLVNPSRKSIRIKSSTTWSNGYWLTNICYFPPQRLRIFWT